MSLIILNVDEVKRTLSASGGAFVVHDKEVDIVRFAINSGFADIVLDGQVALRVMYQRPGETEVRAQTLTYYDTDGLHNYYDWQLAQSDLAKNGSLMVALCILRTDSEVEEWHTTPCQIRVLDTIHTDDSDEADESITPTVAQRVAVLETMIQRVASGAPIVVSSTSAMTDTSRIYVLTTDGKWYYHNGNAWTAGGEYGAVSTDTTLTQSGIPADAKAVGGEISILKNNLDNVASSAFDDTSVDLTFIQGSINSTNGELSSTSLKRCRTKAFAVGSGGARIYSRSRNFKFNVYEYVDSGATSISTRYVGKYTDDWVQDITVYVTTGHCVRIVYARNDTESTLSPTDIADDLCIINRDVTDTSLSKQGKAADAKAVGDELAIIKSDVDAISAYNSTEIEYAPNIVIGEYFATSDGASRNSTKYARTSSLWNGSGYRTAIALEDNVYEFCLTFYGENGDILGTDYIKSSGYVIGGTVVNIIPEAILFGISFRRVDQADLTDSDLTAISAALKCYNSTAEIAKSAAQSALASCESIVVSKGIDKDTGTVKNYYIGYAQGEVKSSSRTVKTLCLECAPNSIYKISHSKSTQFVVASYSSEPVLNSIANKVYNGREESETTFVTDANATWIGIYYYSSANNPDITPEETYDALSISTVGLDTIAETVADLAQAQPSSIVYGFYSSNEVIEMPTTFEGVIELYDGLVAEHPDYVTKNVLTSGDVTNYEYVFTHGDYNRDSSAKRNPDPMIAKPVIILSSGVHGYERSAVISLYKLMSDICNCNYALADLIEYVTIKVIPVGCPWSYTNNSRLNANGVNINRNFATSTWGDYEPGTPGSSDYAGPSAGSEDETKILQAWMEENSDALFYVDFHNSNFSSEVVEIGGPDTEDATAFKKRFLLAINKIIPYWQKARGMNSTNNYYCYTGGNDTIEGRVSRNYAYEAGIHLAFTVETSWNINGTGKHSQTTLNVGAEAMGNFLLGMTDYYKEI